MTPRRPESKLMRHARMVATVIGGAAVGLALVAIVAGVIIVGRELFAP